MAELEVAKHGKKVIQLIGAKEHGWGHRLQDIAVEVATIVFAVWFSIWLHGLSDHRHKQDEVKTFLAGLKTDLRRDIVTLGEMKNAYQEFNANSRYVAGLDPQGGPDGKRFDDAWLKLHSNWYFIPIKSRYEGFLMSGKLANIEDPELLNGIINLYQNLLPQIQYSERGWKTSQDKLLDYLDDALTDGGTPDQYRVLASPKGRRLAGGVFAHPQHVERYQKYADAAQQVVARIDADFPELAAGKR